MKTTKIMALAALGCLSFASACSVEATTAEEQVGSTEQALVCSNPQATNSVMAGLAVASAMEMHRWLPSRDFVWNNTTGMLELSQYAPPRCPGRVCKNTQALLDMQKWEMQGLIIGGSVLDVNSLRTRMKSMFDRQIVCNSRPDNHQDDNCPVENHDMVFSKKVAGSCDTDFWFHAYKMGTSTPLSYPKQLKNQLLYVGGPDNPYLAFDTDGDDVKIDPSYGLIDGDTTTSGSCAAACTKISTSVNIAGQCCTCQGANKTFVKKAGSTTIYTCG